MHRFRSRFFPLLVLAALAISGCVPVYRSPATAPDSLQGHDSLVVRFAAASGDDRQKGKVVVDVDAGRSRLLFLNPLNRVALEMRVSGEMALLINRRKKSYWQGEFKRLLWRMWGIRLEFSQLRSLLFSGSPRTEALENAGFTVRVERHPETGKSIRLVISAPSVSLTMKVLSRRRSAGPLEEGRGTQGLRALDLKGVISREQ